MKVGLDFSINSPGLCIQTDEALQFISFYNIEHKNFKKSHPKDYQTHYDISLLTDVNVIHYNRRKKCEDYSLDQLQKIEDSYSLAKLINSYIPEKSLIALEGYSYGSKGNSFIDLISFNSVVRNNLWLNNHIISIFTPTQVKMKAGKGNLNKKGMFLAFIENKANDPLLINSEFWNWCVREQNMYIDEISKPIDDLIDAYWLVKLLDKI